MQLTQGIVLAVVLASATGCESQSNDATPVKTAPTLANLPVEITVRQRTTTDVPGSKGAVRLTVDDITRGQVMASLAAKDGAVVLAATSLTPGKAAEFELGGEVHFLVLDALANELIGDDAATFVISATRPGEEPPPPAEVVEEAATAVQAEDEKIRQLIEHVATLEGAVFIRNGAEHTPAEAAHHLRQKLEAAGDEITTAEEFIEHAASKSSLSGEEYRIRTADGVEIDAGEYLRKRLAGMGETP